MTGTPPEGEENGNGGNSGGLIDLTGGGALPEGAAPEKAPAGGDGGTPPTDKGPDEGAPRVVELNGERFQVSEDLWDEAANDGDGGINAAAAAKRAGDLRRKLAEMGEKGKAPETYEMTVPEDLAELITPDPEDARWTGLQELGKTKGWTQDDMNEVLKLHYEAEVAAAGDNDAFVAEQETALKEKFGKQTEKVKADLGAWSAAIIGKEMAADPGLAEAATELISSAKGVELLHLLMTKIGDKGIPGGKEIVVEPALSEVKLKSMMRDKRYWDTKDPEYIKQVTDGFKKLYPDKVG